jgi:putative phosphoribosyl transferase
MVEVAQGIAVPALLGLPPKAKGLVIFAHGSGSSRYSSRNLFVAEALNDGELATLLLDLLTAEEEAIDRSSGKLRFDILLLSRRLIAAAGWAFAQPALRRLRLGYFGASTGAAAALVAAAALRDGIAAVVSRGGRPDLAGEHLQEVQAPTLLIVGGADQTILRVNRQALLRIGAERRLAIVANATHLFEEPGALVEVARLSRLWFERYL